MHLGVDYAGEHVQALSVDRRAGRGAAEVADRRDAARSDADVAPAFAVVVDDDSARTIRS